MQSKTIKCVGVNYTVQVPSTPAEFDSLAKREGACLEEAVSNVVYRGTNADFRWAFLNALVAKTNIARETINDPSGKKNEDGSPRQVFKNSEGKDIDLIVATARLDEAACQTIADEVMASTDDKGQPLVSFDPSARERSVKEPSVGKQDLEIALAVLNGPEADLKRVLKNIKKTAGIDIALVDDVATNQRAIALAIKAIRNNPLGMLAA